MSRNTARIRARRTLVLLGALMVIVVAGATAPASAIVEGPCTGSATFPTNGAEVSADQALSIVTLIPSKDTVGYEGAIGVPKPPADKPISFKGGVDAKVAGLGTINVVDWEGETVEIDAKGKYSYEVPDWVPKGTGEILVTATHHHGDTTCVAEVNVKLDGSPGAAAIISATGTLVFGAGTLAAGIKKKGVA